MPTYRHTKRYLFTALLSGVSLLALNTARAEVAATALPTGGTVAGGSASISQQGTDLTVKQTSDKAIINWQTFDVGSSAQVTFVQPGSSSVALNRVLSSAPSTIDGRIIANGKVYLINPAGIVFGAGSVTNVGGLIASTMNTDDKDFMDGKNIFKRDGSTGAIVNKGTITADPHGMIALLAPELRNEGVISAQLGTIIMAAGEQVVLNIENNGGDITVQVDPAQIRTMIDNRSIVVAQDGKVILSAKAADNLIGSTINNSGVIEAVSLTSNGGEIELSGATDIENTGTLDASGVSGGLIKVAAGQTAGLANVGGQIKVAGTTGKGGSATITGHHAVVGDNAEIDATGGSGGGKINVGGSWQNSDKSVAQSEGTLIAATARLDASATANGNGGEIVAWSDVDNVNSVTRAYGTFFTNGGSQGGDGGRIETSGHWLDTAGSQGSAASLYGKSGTWLFDPYNVVISNASAANGAYSGGSPNTWTPSATGSIVDVATIKSRLEAGTSVMITTNGAGGEKGDITVNNAVQKTTGNNDVTFTLSAQNDIFLNADISNSGGSGKMNVQLNADSGHSGIGIIYMNGNITSGGGNVTFGDGTTINLNGNTTYVSGDVYIKDTVARTIDTGGGNFTANGQILINNPNGLSITTNNGSATFASMVDSANDYDLISAPGTDWTTDFNAAKTGTGGGVGDTYMVTVTSHLEGEIVALKTIVSNSFQAVWLGARRVTGLGTDNVWRWVGGPEGLKDKGNGLTFFRQNGSTTTNGTGGSSIGGYYNNWSSGEPNNFGGSALGNENESIIQTLGSTGLWNDLPKTGSALNYYVKETNVADSPFTLNTGSGLVTFNGTVGGNKPISTFTLTTSNPVINVNGGGVYTDSTQTYTQDISLGSSDVTFAVLAGDLITRSGQIFTNNSSGDSKLTLSASGNLELTANTQPVANGHKQSLTLIAGNTLTLDPNVSLDSNGGAIVMQADHLTVDAAASVVGGATGSLQIMPYTQGTSMGIGDTAAGTLNVGTSYFTSNFINNTFGTVIFGGDTTGLVTIGATPALIHDKTVFESGGNMTMAADATLNPSGLIAFQLDSVSGTMTQNSAAVLNVSQLLLSGNSFFLSGTGTFNLTGTHNTVGTLAAANSTVVNFLNQGSLSVGTVGNVSVGTTDGVSATGDVTLQASGATADVTLNKPVSSSGGNVVVAAGRNFINNNSSNTGIVANGSGKRYFVYASDPSTTTEAMTGYSKHYNQTYSAGSTPSYASAGNWFFYTVAPVLSVNLNAASITYGAADPTLTASYTGYIDGDDQTAAGVTGTVGTPGSYTASGANKRPVATYTTTPSPGSLASSKGYLFTAGSNSTLTVGKKDATISSITAADKFFDGNASATLTTIGGFSGVLSGDTVTLGSAVANFDSSSVADGKTVTLVSAVAGGADGNNYNITTSGLTTLAAIKPSSIFIPPVNTTNITPPPTETTIQTQPVTPEQQSQAVPMVTGASSAISMPASSGAAMGQGVTVTPIAAGDMGTGGILATVGDESSGFRFSVPQTSFSFIGAAEGITATMADGHILPSWLVFDSVNRTFSANNIPPNGLPIVVALNDTRSGKSLEITISE